MAEGIVPRIVQSWYAPRRVVRSLTGMSEAGRLVVLIAAMLIFFVAQWPAHARAASLDPSIPLEARLAGAGVAVLFMAPLLAYLLAAVSSLILRLLGRRIRGTDARLALFWALLAISPAVLLSGLLAGFIGDGTGLWIVQGGTAIGFILIWWAGLAELSHPKRRAP